MNIESIKEKRMKEFIYMIPELTPIEFIGVCNLFKVKILTEGAEPRDFSEMLEDCIDTYCALSSKKQKEILRLFKQLRKENKKAVKANGSSAEHK